MPLARVLLALAALVLVASGAVATASGEEAPAPPAGGPAGSAGPADRAVRVLTDWQEARARAYSSGDVAALRRLYVRGSRAGERDVSVLQQYADRGVRVELTVRTDRAAVLVTRPRMVVMRHRSQVVAVAVVGEGRRALPTVAVQWRRTTFRLVDGRWLLSAALRDSGGSPRVPP